MMTLTGRAILATALGDAASPQLAAALFLLFLPYLAVQVWLGMRLFLAFGLVIIHDRSLGDALSESWQATARQQWQIVLVGLALAGVSVGVGLVLGILGQIPVLGMLIRPAGVVVQGLLGVWQMLVLWTAYRDNYGLGDAVGLLAD